MPYWHTASQRQAETAFRWTAKLSAAPCGFWSTTSREHATVIGQRGTGHVSGH